MWVLEVEYGVWGNRAGLGWIRRKKRGIEERANAEERGGIGEDLELEHNRIERKK